MTITQLLYVLAVAEHQNFTKAAEKCFVTQPTGLDITGLNAFK